MSLDGYRDWLKKQRYTPSTIEASLKVLRRLDAVEPKPTPTDEFLLRRYLRYVKESRRNPMGEKFTEALKTKHDLFRPAVERAKSGKRKRRLLTLTEFHELKTRLLKRGDDAGPLLVLYMSTGMKPRTFLQTQIKSAQFGFPLSIASWLSEHDRSIFLYQIISPSLSWAYRKLLAVLKKEAAGMDIDADLGTLYRSRLELR
jgi:hypothetical protein